MLIKTSLLTSHSIAIHPFQKCWEGGKRTGVPEEEIASIAEEW
ncbi:hypothetical protein [Brevibacillus laterosporus]|nr:hypothetical protein [Brevibacillus laterosporus]MED1909914.1 hypothetical protein [Brevibacillus laterosporus]WNX30885.1 hypothetical protein RWW94_22305 [Brevibacillus laterosporus]